MVRNHLKTMAAPKTWLVKRHQRRFIMRPSPGPHSLKNSITVNFLLIELLKLAKIKREATVILEKGDVLVNGIMRKQNEFPLGLFDTVSIAGKDYTIIMDNHGKLLAQEGKNSQRAHKITGKSLHMGKIQLSFYNGHSMMTGTNDYKVGDSLIIDDKKQVKKHLKLEKGAHIFLLGGKNLGEKGTVEDVIGNKIIYKKGDTVEETLKRYAFVIET